MKNKFLKKLKILKKGARTLEQLSKLKLITGEREIRK